MMSHARFWIFSVLDHSVSQALTLCNKATHFWYAHCRFIPGGSSSGSGAAVGASLVSFALGTDTAGSGTQHDSKSSQILFPPCFTCTCSDRCIPCSKLALFQTGTFELGLSQLQPSCHCPRASEGSSTSAKVWLEQCVGCIIFSADGHSSLLLSVYKNV